MYKTHATKVQSYAQRSADNMADVCLMVSLSIQQNWLGVGDMLADVRVNKIGSRFLWGFKADTYSYIMTHKHKIYGQMKAVINSNKSDKDKAVSLMRVFLRVPGLGLPKAGFMCQLCVGLVGCMDVHNIKLYGLNENALKLPKSLKNPTKITEKIENYVKLCHDYGTELLWNSWCENLATKSVKWVDGFHVSEVHYTYLTQKGRLS
tara:strand:- start:2626 stop:3243 length:618 start_codon:yes stop_codon:yes gene_type:complete